MDRHCVQYTDIQVSNFILRTSVCIWECKKDHDKDDYTSPITDKMLQLILFLFWFALIFLSYLQFISLYSLFCTWITLK